MEEEEDICFCFLHKNKSLTFCDTCKRLVCSDCSQCKGHEKQCLSKLVKCHKRSFPPKASTSFKKYVSLVLHGKRKIMMRMAITAELLNEQINDFGRIDKISSGINGVDDRILSTEIINYLRQVQMKVSTNVLATTIQRAIETFDIDDLIAGEIKKNKKVLKNLGAKLLRANYNLKRVEVEQMWLETILRTDNIKNKEVQTALSLCLANNILSPSSCGECRVVRKAFPINRVFTKELFDVGLGIRMTKPLKVKKELRAGDNILCSVSHNGILAVCANKRVQLTDLSKWNQIHVDVEDDTNTGFFDKSLIFLTIGKRLRMSSVDAIFGNQSLSLLKSVGSVEVDGWMDVSLLHQTRTLMFISTSGIPHKYDVDTKKTREVDVGMNVYSFASFTGVNIGLDGVFRENGKGYSLYSLSQDKATKISECNLTGPLSFVIPSSSDPKNLIKSMKIYWNGSFFVNSSEHERTIKVFKFQYWQSMVRLYHDIFLVYDCDTKSWCLVRIIVP